MEEEEGEEEEKEEGEDIAPLCLDRAAWRPLSPFFLFPFFIDARKHKTAHIGFFRTILHTSSYTMGYFCFHTEVKAPFLCLEFALAP